jgi:hypothetical protein
MNAENMSSSAETAVINVTINVLYSSG